MIANTTYEAVVVKPWKQGGRRWRITVTSECVMYLQECQLHSGMAGDYWQWTKIEKPTHIDPDRPETIANAVQALQGIVSDWCKEEVRRASIIEKVRNIWLRNK